MIRIMLAIANLLVVAIVITVAAPATAATSRPNIVLCMADDLGWGDVGFNGNRVIRTPHLDAMARAGLRFTRFYAGAPVCSPTRGSVLTGRHPYRYGIFFANVGHLPPGELTLAELLRTAGYRTGHFGKWHLGTLTTTVKDSNRGGPRGIAHFSPPWRNGFDICFSTEAKVPTWDPMLRPQNVRRNTWWNPLPDSSSGKPYGTAYWTNGRQVTENLRGDDSRIIMDRALPFIRKAARNGRPFFAVIWFHAPHLPVVAGPKFAAMYAKQPGFARNYFGCITAMDEQIGRLRTELCSLGVADNTMLWFTSDNGPEGTKRKSPGSSGPFRGRKRSLYEGGVRVPGLVEWPARVRPGSVTDFPASTLDYLPTIVEALGLMPADRVDPLDGISLLPVLSNRPATRTTPIPFESRGRRALIGPRYKLLCAPPAGRRRQRKSSGSGKQPRAAAPTKILLFDLIADPSESRNIAADHPDIVQKMSATLAHWRASCQQSRDGRDYKLTKPGQSH